MARIERETQKVFGGNAPLNQITTFGSIKEGNPVYSSDVGDLQTEAFETGWTAAVEDDYAPYRQDRNAVDKVTTSQLAYQFQEGVAEWDVGTTYYKGSIVKINTSTGFNLYNSLTDDNVGNNPKSSTENWQLWTDNSFPYSRITNCITYIPQDIKLELNNGTLTLKAGSKVYVPNGAGVFDVININEDKVWTWVGGAQTKSLLYIDAASGNFGWTPHSASGTATESVTSTMYYRTDLNRVLYQNATSSNNYSFPIAMFSYDSTGKVTSIDQVFNGLGYIGGSVFMLPGVEVLLTNGVNNDGSVKSIKMKIVNVRVNNNVLAWGGVTDLNIIVFSTSVELQSVARFSENFAIPAGQAYIYSYNTSDNRWYYSSNGGVDWSKINIAVVGRLRANSNTGVVSDFNIKNAFRIMDESDAPRIVYWE